MSVEKQTKIKIGAKQRIGVKQRFAKMSRYHLSLFKSFKRGNRGRLDVKHEGSDYSVRFVGPWELGADDLRVLLAVLYFVGKEGMYAPADSDLYGLLKIMIKSRFDDGGGYDVLRIKIRLSDLLNSAGLVDAGNNRRRVLECLRRMSCVTAFVHVKRYEASFHLMSWGWDEGEDYLEILVDPLLSHVVLGDGGWVRVDLYRGLSGPALLLHARLCSVIDPGKGRYLDWSTVERYVWGDVSEQSSSLRKERRRALRRAIDAITACGWVAEERKRGHASLGVEFHRDTLM